MADITPLPGRPTVPTRGQPETIIKQTARGLIHDMVRELAMMTCGTAVTGPEEMEFHDRVYVALGDYVTAKKSAGLAQNYLSPSSQALAVTKTSPLLAGDKVEPTVPETEGDKT